MGDVLLDNDGWLAVKPNIFKDSADGSKLKPNFHVNWNFVERKFCITFNEHSRVKSDTSQRYSFTTSMSLDELKYAHQSLINLNDEIVSFPEIPTDCWSEYLMSHILSKPENFQDKSWKNYLWSYALTNFDASVMDKLSIQIENYLCLVYQKCTHFTFMSILFPNEFTFEEYFENMSDLRHKMYIEKLDHSKANYESLIKNRSVHRRKAHPKNRDVDMDGIKNHYFYQLCHSVDELMELLAEYYTYLKQPFLDVREISAEKIRYAKLVIQSPDLGERVKETMKEKMPNHQDEYRNSVENLRELQIQFYNETRKLLASTCSVYCKQ